MMHLAHRKGPIATCVLSFLVLILGGDFALAQCPPLVIDVLFGEPIPFDVMVDDLATVRIIYIGEVHTIQRHHDLQAQVIRQLSERKMKLALGMEMFSEAQQPVLDQWQRGTTDVSKLIDELGKEHWTNLKDYESVLLVARELGIPVFGLNAHDGVVRKIARDGMDGLDGIANPTLKEEARNINPLNERLLKLRLQVHRSFKDKSLDRIILAQSFRDAIMAHAVTQFINSPNGGNTAVIVIAGSGHLNYGFGIPERVHRQTGLSFRIVLPSESGELVLSEEEKRQSVPLRITHEDLSFIRTPIADYLHVISPANLDSHRTAADDPPPQR